MLPMAGFGIALIGFLINMMGWYWVDSRTVAIFGFVLGALGIAIGWVGVATGQVSIYRDSHKDDQ